MHHDGGLWTNVEIINNEKYICKVREFNINPYFDCLICTAVTTVLLQISCSVIQSRISHWTLGTCSHDLLRDRLKKEKTLKYMQEYIHIQEGLPLLKACTTHANEKETRLFWQPQRNMLPVHHRWLTSAMCNMADTNCTQKFCPWRFHCTLNHCTLQHRKVVFPPFLSKVKTELYRSNFHLVL